MSPAPGIRRPANGSRDATRVGPCYRCPAETTSTCLGNGRCDRVHRLPRRAGCHSLSGKADTGWCRMRHRVLLLPGVSNRNTGQAFSASRRSETCSRARHRFLPGVLRHPRARRNRLCPRSQTDWHHPSNHRIAADSPAPVQTR